ncbi:Rv0361 family membrane protein [Nocardia amikacinitolerans]|uniref:Rv0361 family membrane protein n=1 Tax=Nocardia amikacinitolerans TaxID=756689 RepID=UPI0020A5E718|nr:hypothetical protein [Nocardia amikacinitolerans]MCP2291592.1 hypothetical protein [Nocardia amikacinitolerans]
MTEQKSPDEGEPIKVDQTDKRSLAPFLAAAALAVVVLVAIGLGGVLSPAEKNVTEAEKIAGAVGNFVEGANNTDMVPPPGTGCPHFDPAKSPLAGQEGTGKAIELIAVTDQTLNGDRAKATVTTKVDGKEYTATWNLTRTDDKWLVCNV